MDYIKNGFAADHGHRTPEFPAAAGRLFDDDERAALIDFLARNPTAGDLVPETGGIRKLRWGVGGRGKRGGVRAIYYFHSADLPLFALTVYAKNERADLTQSDRNDFRRLTTLLVQSLSDRRNKR